MSERRLSRKTVREVGGGHEGGGPECEVKQNLRPGVDFCGNV
jgi:hypothetical protein